MKKLLLTTMVLGSTVTVAACSGTTSEDGLDGGLTNAPYTEERTIATTSKTGSTAVATTTTPAAPAHNHAHGHGHDHGHSSAAHSDTTTYKSADPVFKRGLVK